eukprot:COSAG02_NODE_1280_length_13477_cov_9.042906_3_plen_70_part_00
MIKIDDCRTWPRRYVTHSGDVYIHYAHSMAHLCPSIRPMYAWRDKVTPGIRALMPGVTPRLTGHNARGD